MTHCTSLTHALTLLHTALLPCTATNLEHRHSGGHIALLHMASTPTPHTSTGARVATQHITPECSTASVGMNLGHNAHKQEASQPLTPILSDDAGTAPELGQGHAESAMSRNQTRLTGRSECNQHSASHAAPATPAAATHGSACLQL
jgi:hypothetical protein